MSLLKKAAATFSLVLTLGLAAAPPAQASYVFASADMNIGSLRFSFDDPNAVLVWAADWFGTVTAHAQDTDSGSDNDYAEYLGNDGSISAEAHTAHVNSLATYEVQDGLNVAIDPNADVAATTHSDLELSGKHKQADGFANANFDNFFFVSSTDPIGLTVQVTIDLDYAGQLTGIADAGGFFDIFAGAFLELYEIDQVTGVVREPAVAFDLFFDAASGSNTSYHNDFDGTLSVTYDLLYDDIYWLYAEADSEVYGAVPVPGSLSLLLLGAGILVWRRRR